MPNAYRPEDESWPNIQPGDFDPLPEATPTAARVLPLSDEEIEIQRIDHPHGSPTACRTCRLLATMDEDRAQSRAAERRVIALLSDERQANADLRAALAASEASQRALRWVYKKYGTITLERALADYQESATAAIRAADDATKGTGTAEWKMGETKEVIFKVTKRMRPELVIEDDEPPPAPRGAATAE